MNPSNENPFNASSVTIADTTTIMPLVYGRLDQPQWIALYFTSGLTIRIREDAIDGLAGALLAARHEMDERRQRAQQLALTEANGMQLESAVVLPGESA